MFDILTLTYFHIKKCTLDWLVYLSLDHKRQFYKPPGHMDIWEKKIKSWTAANK